VKFFKLDNLGLRLIHIEVDKMVYCRYCGEKNKDEALICKKCGKPLSLLPNLHPKNMNNNIPNRNYKKDLNPGFRRKKPSNFNQGSIKSRYKDKNRFNTDFGENGYRINQSEELNNLSPSQPDYYDDYSRKNLQKQNKNYVEWDVVVATALLVIILATILQRFFHTFGLFVALLIGLIYILTATKSKISLFKAIPLAIIMVFAISAYFTL